MKKITRREIAAFVLGIISVFVIDLIVNWDDSVREFNKGWDEAHQKANNK